MEKEPDYMLEVEMDGLLEVGQAIEKLLAGQVKLQRISAAQEAKIVQQDAKIAQQDERTARLEMQVTILTKLVDSLEVRVEGAIPPGRFNA